jgi:hypothetical protein
MHLKQPRQGEKDPEPAPGAFNRADGRCGGAAGALPCGHGPFTPAAARREELMELCGLRAAPAVTPRQHTSERRQLAVCVLRRTSALVPSATCSAEAASVTSAAAWKRCRLSATAARIVWSSRWASAKRSLPGAQTRHERGDRLARSLARARAHPLSASRNCACRAPGAKYPCLPRSCGAGWLDTKQNSSNEKHKNLELVQVGSEALALPEIHLRVHIASEPATHDAWPHTDACLGVAGEQ